jgi:mono/diheme cytochrome c family protein
MSDNQFHHQAHPEQNDFNKGGMITFALSFAASIGIMLYVSFFSPGVDLKEVREEAAVEQTVAGGAAEAPKKIDVAAIKEPWLSSDDLVAHGKQLYAQNCAMCHGAEGRGDGVAGGGLNPKPRNLVEGKWKKGGDRLGLYDVLQNGIAGGSMQSYKHLAPADRWALVHFIQSITENKVADNEADVAAKAPSLN